MVLPVRLTRIPDWVEGPFPFELGSRRTDAETRSTYFAPASARVLYGAPDGPAAGTCPRTSSRTGCKLLGMAQLTRGRSSRPFPQVGERKRWTTRHEYW